MTSLGGGNAGRVVGLRLEHRPDLRAQLGRVCVAVHRFGVLGRGGDYLVLIADDRERAVGIALSL